jgi:hypothetical protein
VAYASRKGRPLNRYVVIAWDLAPSDLPAPERFAGLIERLRKWLQQRYGEPLFAYVWENPPGGPLHVNLLVYVERTDMAKFDRMVRKWVLDGAHDVRRGYICCRKIRNLDGLVRYLLKGGDEAVRGAFQIPLHFPANQGQISFKRLGLARCLDAAARRRNAAAGRPLGRLKAQLFGSCSTVAMIAGWGSGFQPVLHRLRL